MTGARARTSLRRAVAIAIALLVLVAGTVAVAHVHVGSGSGTTCSACVVAQDRSVAAGQTQPPVPVWGIVASTWAYVAGAPAASATSIPNPRGPPATPSASNESVTTIGEA